MKSREHVTAHGKASFYASIWDDLRNAAMENGWVKVEDRLPENEDEVLVVHTEAGGISIAFYCDELKRWVPTDTDIERNGQILVTHWRPLPPPPSNR